METTEKSLMPQMSVPVERRLFEASAVGGNGAASVVASNWGCRHHCGSSSNQCYVDCVRRVESYPH